MSERGYFTPAKQWAQSMGEAVGKNNLRFAERVSNTFFVPIGMHRLKNALGLSLGLYLGRKLMNVLVGATTDGEAVDKDSLPGFLQPFHGVFAYNHFSDDAKDRWMKVFDYLVPGVLGAIGCWMGSYSFLRMETNLQGRMANPITLDRASNFADYERSKPFGILTCLSALFGSSSGLALIAPISYGAFLGARFTQGSAKATDMWICPPLGRWLMGTKSTFTNRPAGLVKELIEYAANNTSATPEKMEDYARGIIMPYFKNVNEEQIRKFVNLVHDARNCHAIEVGTPGIHHFEKGNLPEEVSKKIGDQLKTILEGNNLLGTFQKCGLDINELQLGDYGHLGDWSQRINKFFGREDTVEKVRQGMLKQFAKEQAEQEAAKLAAAAAAKGVGV